MAESIAEFFERFAQDVPTFDGRLIASRYLAPYIAVSSDGDLWECREESDVVDYFQNLLDKHQEQGVAHCEYEDLISSPIGKKGYFATVTWTMSDKEGNTITHWRESYNLIKTNEGLKILTSMDH